MNKGPGLHLITPLNKLCMTVENGQNCVIICVIICVISLHIYRYDDRSVHTFTLFLRYNIQQSSNIIIYTRRCLCPFYSMTLRSPAVLNLLSIFFFEILSDSKSYFRIRQDLVSDAVRLHQSMKRHRIACIDWWHGSQTMLMQQQQKKHNNSCIFYGIYHMLEYFFWLW